MNSGILREHRASRPNIFRPVCVFVAGVFTTRIFTIHRPAPWLLS
jgi:hypothetical protein